MQFDWDEHNIAHIWRHRVLPEEAEQAVLIAPVEVDFLVRAGEERVQILGLTAKGRLLSVFYTERSGKIGVVTAFDATSKQRSKYYKWAGFRYVV